MDGSDDLHLDRHLRERVEALADRLNASVAEVIRRAVDLFERGIPPEPPSNAEGRGDRSLYDAFAEKGLVGSIKGPGDMSTNPKYFEGFGRD